MSDKHSLLYHAGLDRTLHSAAVVQKMMMVVLCGFGAIRASRRFHNRANLTFSPATKVELRLIFGLLINLTVLLRFCAMLFFVYRSIPWWEAVVTGLGMAYIQPTFMALGARERSSAASVRNRKSCYYFRSEFLSNCIFLGVSSFGAAISTISEWQRRSYLARHPGTLFTGGLFSHVRHINYSGEVLLFLGWAAWTRSCRALLVPSVFLPTFILFYIPNLDAHLLEKHGSSFAAYRSETPSLLPWFFGEASDIL